jgi:hypothetical protein
MPRNSNNKSSSAKNKVAPIPAPAPAPATIISQQSTLWSGVKTGFGMTIGNKVANLIFGDPVVRHINETSSSNVPKSTVGAAATQDMTGQIQYMQCMKEGGIEEMCKEHLS